MLRQKDGKRESRGRGGEDFFGSPFVAMFEEDALTGAHSCSRLRVYVPHTAKLEATTARRLGSGAHLVDITLHGEHEREALVEALEQMLDERRLSLSAKLAERRAP